MSITAAQLKGIKENARRAAIYASIKETALVAIYTDLLPAEIKEKSLLQEKLAIVVKASKTTTHMP